MTSPKTIRVRIAVGLKGDIWHAWGSWASDDSCSKRFVREDAGDAFAPTAWAFVEADIPLPESVTVEGTVQP